MLSTQKIKSDKTLREKVPYFPLIVENIISILEEK